MDHRRRETRMSSHSSGSTGSEFVQTRQDLPTPESVSTEWTDEKHSLYLKSMEASFVDQLYNSMNLLGVQVQDKMSNPKLSQQVHCNAHVPSGQFKVLQDGCWKKINFRKTDSHVNMANEPHGLLINPWIQHFKSARKPQVAFQENATVQSQATNFRRRKEVKSGTATSLKHSYPCGCHSCSHCLIDSNKGNLNF
uniref:Cold regulated protein 27 n=1 Tax=Manihot esculenta TaxID=3983 RepID=A0A2C9U0I8_MANES